MDGRNSSGRTVSLLNDAAPSLAPVAAQFTKLPPLTTLTEVHHHHHHHHHHTTTTNTSTSSRPHSASPSEASTPSLSPQTPPLIRSSSSDSRAFGTPSPQTPQSSSFDGAQQHKFGYRPWSKMDDPSLYPQMADTAPMGYSLPPMSGTILGVPVPQMRSSDSPVSDSRVSNVSGASAAGAASSQKTGTKKSQYPCPLAKQFKCSDFFTTSGHAARHAKKHTGRKDAICPECNKAFTRKDNMEQHRRTHQNVRGPISSKAAAEPSRVKKSVKQSSSRKGPDSMSIPLAAAIDAHIEQQSHPTFANPEEYPISAAPHMGAANEMPVSGPYFMSAEPVASLPQPVHEYSSRPPLYRSGFTGLSTFDFNSTVTPGLADSELHFTYPSPGLSNGLNTLALVASDHRRMSEEASSSSAKSESTTP